MTDGTKLCQEWPEKFQWCYVEMLPGERYGKYLVISYSARWQKEAHVRWEVPFGHCDGYVSKIVLLHQED